MVEYPWNDMDIPNLWNQFYDTEVDVKIVGFRFGGSGVILTTRDGRLFSNAAIGDFADLTEDNLWSCYRITVKDVPRIVKFLGVGSPLGSP